jgi:predicted TIM-barrel fold metal-dependent hydrolase
MVRLSGFELVSALLPDSGQCTFQGSPKPLRIKDYRNGTGIAPTGGSCRWDAQSNEREKQMKAILLAAALLLPASTALCQERLFDIHVHLHNGEASIPLYEDQLKRANISVTGFGAMWFGGPNQAPAGEIAQTRSHNDALQALSARHPGMMPIGTVHPYDGQDAIAELERIAARGIKVLKLHPHTQKFDVTDPRVLALVKRAGELNIVVLMDNANIIAGDSENLFNLAVNAPKTKFIFAHMGGLNFRFWNILALARTAENFFADNIYFDISGTSVIAAGSPVQDEFVWTMRNVGVDHILLGSDFPQMSLPQTLAAFDRLGLTEDEKSKIRYDNARKLFGLK